MKIIAEDRRVGDSLPITLGKVAEPVGPEPLEYLFVGDLDFTGAAVIVEFDLGQGRGEDEKGGEQME